jgi:hypothetical protein
MLYIPVLYRAADEGILKGSSVVGAPMSRAEALDVGNEWYAPKLGLNLYVCGVRNGKIVSYELIKRNDKTERKGNPMSETTLVEKWIEINPVAGNDRPTTEELADAMITAFEAMEVVEPEIPRAANIADQISDVMHSRSPSKRRSRQLVKDAEEILYERFSSGCDPDVVQAFDGESTVTIKAPWHADWIENALDLGGEYGGGVWTFPIEAKSEVIAIIHKTFPDFTSEQADANRQENPAKKDLEVGNIDYGKKVLDIAKQKKYKLDKYEAVVSVIAAANMDRKTAQKAVRDATEPPPKKELTEAEKKEKEQKKIERELKKLEPYLEKMSEPSRKMVEEQIKKNVKEGVPCIPMPEEGDTLKEEVQEAKAAEEIEEAVKEVEEKPKAKEKSKPKAKAKPKAKPKAKAKAKAKPKAKPKAKAKAKPKAPEPDLSSAVAGDIWSRGNKHSVVVERAGKKKLVPLTGVKDLIEHAVVTFQDSLYGVVYDEERDQLRIEPYVHDTGTTTEGGRAMEQKEEKASFKLKPKPLKLKPKPVKKETTKMEPKQEEGGLTEEESKQAMQELGDTIAAVMAQMLRKKNPSAVPYKGPQSRLF